MPNTLKRPKTLSVLVKSINFFNLKTIQLLGDDRTSEEIIKKHCPSISFIDDNADVIFGNIADLKNTDVEVNKLPSASMLLLNGIHKNSENIKNWEYIKTLEHVSVSLDLFYCGVIFFRKEQVKEHFKIRI
ncbi:MAG: hypothetical protein NWP64_04735 [Maribacter sp.]|nr:hypothetical protein [Maribacter sp.]